MKGIIVAGGTGSRLFPITKSVSKHLLPIFDKPMIYYPLSVLMLAGIRDILIVTTPRDLEAYKVLLSNGSDFGINIQYLVQSRPDGIAQAILIADKFIDNNPVCLILGDNIFHGQGFRPLLVNAAQLTDGAIIFGYRVMNPSDFGVVEFNIATGQAISLEEKPRRPKSNIAVTGLYFYDRDVVDIAKSIRPSERGELEITTVNQIYLERQNLSVKRLGRGFAWLDTGTPQSLLQAGQFVETIQKRHGYKLACPEEIAFEQNWITSDDIERLANGLRKTEYGDYLNMLISGPT